MGKWFRAQEQKKNTKRNNRNLFVPLSDSDCCCWCWGYFTEQQCKFPYLAENMDSSSTTTRGSKHSTRAGPQAASWSKRRPGYRLQSAAGYAAPNAALVWPACITLPGGLHCCRTAPASWLHPLTETACHPALRADCEGAALRFKGGEACLFARVKPRRHAGKILLRTVWYVGLNGYKSIFSLCLILIDSRIASVNTLLYYKLGFSLPSRNLKCTFQPVSTCNVFLLSISIK